MDTTGSIQKFGAIILSACNEILIQDFPVQPV
jgi:hypothetical protein